MNDTRTKETVAVGISGGVDSSVAAYLLKEQGYKVIGIFVKTWSPEWLPCTWVDEKRDAMRVCAALDIPFYFLDAEEVYKNGVAEYMINEYRTGHTPNPDVLCNRIIKFGVLWEYAQTLGATKIATGHYAHTDGYSLMKANDPSKDQSYFLWMITQPEFAHILFPLGTIQKSEVRKIAKKANLFTAVKKDSQGICFLGAIDMREFLSHYIEQKKGIVVDSTGRELGEHDGVWFYTIGERHGFRITQKKTDRTPYYVIGKNISANTLIVSNSIKEENKNTTEKQTVFLREINWHSSPEIGKKYTAQIRYHGAVLSATVVTEACITLVTSEALPLGQSVVLYDGSTVIGAGIIDKV